MKLSVGLALLGVLFSLNGGFVVPVATAADTPSVEDAEKEKIRQIVKDAIREYVASQRVVPEKGGANAILADIRLANRNFVRTHGPDYFKPFLDGQHPRATVITGSDSRVHSHALDATPDGDLFMVRNIGNQMSTAEGSVEYGVHHLHTPLLLIVGHSACGAIKAAAGDYSQESAPIRRELDTLQIPKGDPGMNSIKLNVNYQVGAARSKFEREVIEGQLTVVGAIYDFTNEMRQGQGKLNIINVNGETDAAKIAALEFMKEGPVTKSMPTRHRRASRKAKVEADAVPESTDEPTKNKSGR